MEGSANSSGLIILCGLPGSGKTTRIQWATTILEMPQYGVNCDEDSLEVTKPVPKTKNF
jgi:tRNA uridine 5-carbamoylmethylation protein Kti12